MMFSASLYGWMAAVSIITAVRYYLKWQKDRRPFDWKYLASSCAVAIMGGMGDMTGKLLDSGNFWTDFVSGFTAGGLSKFILDLATSYAKPQEVINEPEKAVQLARIEEAVGVLKDQPGPEVTPGP